MNRWSDLQWRVSINDAQFIAKVLKGQKPKLYASILSKLIPADEPLRYLTKLLPALYGQKELQKSELLSSIVSKLIPADQPLRYLTKLLPALYGQKEVQKQIINQAISGFWLNNKAQGDLMLWAADCGNVSVVKILSDKKALLNAKNEFGETPLALATRKGHTNIVIILRKKGANVNSADNKSYTSRYAFLNGRSTIDEKLAKQGEASNNAYEAG